MHLVYFIITEHGVKQHLPYGTPLSQRYNFLYYKRILEIECMKTCMQAARPTNIYCISTMGSDECITFKALANLGLNFRIKEFQNDRKILN